ncbi:MAG: diguanylate cyclase (GGDEF)-like protein [Paraglaciecola sp.]
MTLYVVTHNAKRHRVLGTFLLSFCLFLFTSVNALAVPEIPEPIFTRLSTAQGLPQDTVRNVLLDQDGFLWLGTQFGLNRYDGYQVVAIPGADNQFVDEPISYLFQDAAGWLWIGTYNAGVYKMDLKTGHTDRVVAIPSLDKPQWLQYASSINQDSSGAVWLAMDQSVLRYSTQTGESTQVYELAPEAITKGVGIRWVWGSDDIAIIATTEGLLGIDLATQKSVKIDYLQDYGSQEDRLNAKVLHLDKQNTLWVGTVEGLYSLPFSELKSYIQGRGPLPGSRVRVELRNIWRILPDDEQHLYLATDRGLFSYASDNNELTHLFRPTDSRDSLAKDEIYDLAFDANNNLWLGTRSDGALYWSARSTLFQNVFNVRGGRDHKILSDNNVWSLYQQNKDTLWVGTDNGLNAYNLSDGSSNSYLVSPDDKAQYSSATINEILPAGNKQLWLVTGEGLARFDTQQGISIPLRIKNENDREILSQWLWGAEVADNGDLWFITDGGFYRYSWDTETVTRVEQLSDVLPAAKAQGFIGHLPGQSQQKIISLIGGLYQWDTQSKTLKAIHKLIDEQHHKTVSPSSWVIDNNNIMWISYAGFGLVGLDAKTFEKKYFYNEDNLLPSNSIYSLQKDKQGNIWISSHNGLLKFDPDTHALQRFSQAQGVGNEEFNQYAQQVLQDGRLAYGSPKGVTLFYPEEVLRKQARSQMPKITDIALYTTKLTNPLNDLSGRTITLEHDDLGLTIFFSTLSYEDQSSTRYHYLLSGAANIDYPITRNANVNFPKLSPGHYQFQVSAIDAAMGGESKAASIDIIVRHAPFSSPLAYGIYAGMMLLFILLLWRNRQAEGGRLIAAHKEVLQSKERLSLALNASNSNVWEWQASNNLIFSPRISKELEYIELPNTVNLKQHIALIHKQDRGFYEASWQRFLENRETLLDVTYRMRAKNNSWLWFRDVGSFVDNTSNKLTVAGTYTNVTETIAEREELRLFGEAYKHARDWVLVCSSRRVPLAANKAFCEAFGIVDETSLRNQLNALYREQPEGSLKFWGKLSTLNANEDWRGEDKIMVKNQRLSEVLVYAKAVASLHDASKIDSYLVILSDISVQKKAQKELVKLANFDSLTGLPNRTLLLDRINHAIDHAVRNHSTIALFFIDLDKFKQVNDSLGHKAGDTLLQEISSRLLSLLRKDDTVARLGGDEFVVMVENVQNADKLSGLANEIIRVIDTPVQLDNQSVGVSSSIGIALFPDDATNSQELLENADVAMYHAKEQGRSNFQFFTTRMNIQAQQRLALESDLKEAHQNNQLSNHYQPIVSIYSGKVVGFELLMRWFTPSGKVSPGRFIPVAEELGLIEQMTQDAMLRALPMLKRWQDDKFDGYLSINLSARHFAKPSSIDNIIALLAENNLPVRSIHFEITESALMKDYEKALTYMQELQSRGFVIALDDFGTGYSSLKYLKEFPIQFIKVDKSFVDGIGINKNNEALIVTTLRMAESLDMDCIAEGIETAEQIAFFKHHGCDLLQGYYFARPVALDDTYALLEKTWDI